MKIAVAEIMQWALKHVKMYSVVDFYATKDYFCKSKALLWIALVVRTTDSHPHALACGWMSIKVPPAQARSDKMNTNTQHMKGVQVVTAVISLCPQLW